MADYGATERVREFVEQHFFEPARRVGERRVTIQAGTLGKLLEERQILPPNRFPLICGALGSQKFARKNGVSLEMREGPSSGQSSAATFTYRLDSVGDSGPVVAKSKDPEWEKTTVFLRKDTRKAASRQWEDEEGGDFSDLVEHLLSNYLKSPKPKAGSLLSLRGILKDTYRELGGATAFHEAERESWER